MLYFEKSQPAPKCLENEKVKSSGNYYCGDVLDRIKKDFHNKCYICENAEPHSINIEHFIPHKGDPELKFSWDNLFFSCSHCNNTKLDKFDNILNCTNIDDNVEKKLQYFFNPFPGEKVRIETTDNDDQTLNTKKLIESVFNGTTELKKLESSNIRNTLLLEIQEFQHHLTAYFKKTCDDDDKKHYLREIKHHLNKSSNFTSFKHWIIKNNEVLADEFGGYLTQ